MTLANQEQKCKNTKKKKKGDPEFRAYGWLACLRSKA